MNISYSARLMMNKQEFLASGLMEQYTLGLTSPEETALVEHFIAAHPEVKLEMNALQKAVEDYAAQYAIPPPRHLKKKILSEISSENGLKIEPSSGSRTAIFRKWTISLACLLLLVIGLVSYLAWKQQTLKAEVLHLSDQLTTYRTQYQQLQQQTVVPQKLMPLLENPYTLVIHLQGKPDAPQAHAIAYWNVVLNNAYIQLIDMPTLASDKQYQIWADVNGKMINLGILNMDTLQDINFLENAASLTITVEPKGGSTQPNVSQLIADGKI